MLDIFQMHHLINELRPHQARESIRVCLRMQKKQREETAAKLSKQIERIQDIIRTAIKNIKDNDINNLLQETLPENFQTNTNSPSIVMNGNKTNDDDDANDNDADDDDHDDD
ncbi:hypothetical protein BLA29_013943, partial [Euroglyphus maynei]